MHFQRNVLHCGRSTSTLPKVVYSPQKAYHYIGGYLNLSTWGGLLCLRHETGWCMKTTTVFFLNTRLLCTIQLHVRIDEAAQKWEKMRKFNFNLGFFSHPGRAPYTMSGPSSPIFLLHSFLLVAKWTASSSVELHQSVTSSNHALSGLLRKACHPGPHPASPSSLLPTLHAANVS